MKNVLLLHQKLLFYRIPIYNRLSAFLERRGFHLTVWYDGIAPQGETVDFDTLEVPMTRRNYRRILEERNISTVVNFLNRKTKGIFFYLYAVLYARLSGRKTVYYGHGLNLDRRENPLELLAANLILLLFDRIILYSPAEKRYLGKRNRGKVSIAYNTLDMEGRAELVTESREEIKKKYGMGEEFIVLFSGRIEPRKRLDMLVDIFTTTFKDRRDVGLVIVGPGLSSKLESRLTAASNIHYLGPVYDTRSISEVFSAADLFCIPGHLGLAVVEAFHWGLPVLTATRRHAPEYYYLKEGINGLTLNGERELAQTLEELARDRERVRRMSEEARKTFLEEARVERMLEGYLAALEGAERG